MRVHLVPEAAREHLREYPKHEFHGIDAFYAACKNCDTVYERTVLTLSMVWCAHCGAGLGMSYSTINGVYCDEMCYRRGNHHKRKLRDNPQA